MWSAFISVLMARADLLSLLIMEIAFCVFLAVFRVVEVGALVCCGVYVLDLVLVVFH